ncbi:MAG: hypothetical protein IIU63_03510 [Clostridia bacterium]|nr:hypothetical protein [Clostridia bacterium]
MKNKKILIIALIALGSLIALLGSVIVGCIGYYRLGAMDYYAASEKAFFIPGLKEGYVPQGMHYCEDEEVFLLSGYFAAGGASPIYVVDAVTGECLQKVVLQNKDGTAFTGHGSGITRNGDFVYVSGESEPLNVYSYAEIMAAEYGASIRCLGDILLSVSEEDYVTPSCLTIHDGVLTVGEFYLKEKYPTLPSHHVTTKAGDVHYALAVDFALDENAELGISTTPIKAYSIPGRVQGMCFNGDRVYVSTSWSFAFSYILEYDLTRSEEQGTIEVMGTTVPLYAMDSASLIKDYKIAPMSEELAFVNGKLYVYCESACSKYLLGRLIGGKWCYATDLGKMK